MVADTERLAQMFLWKQGDAPDADYARELLRATNPAASQAVEGDASIVQLFAVAGEWPEDPWALALAHMDAIPAPTGTQWTDPANYDLAGWQGKDLRTGEDLFVVTAYRRPAQPAQATQTAPTVTQPEADMTATPPVAQTPYQPQYPTGPIAWPPRSAQGSNAQDAGEAERPQAAAYYPGRYSPLNTEPLETVALSDNITGPLVAAVQAALLDSYAPYYAAFGPRLVAALIDLFFTMIFPLVAIVAMVLRAQAGVAAASFGQYALVAGLGLAVFAVYHIVQIGLWGQTLGKALVGIRVVRPDGSVPGFGRATLRVLGYGFSLLIAGWGFLRVAVDPRRQALHDRIAETLVIPEKLDMPVPAGLPGYRRATPTSPISPTARREEASEDTSPATGMAAVASVQEYDRAQLSTAPQLSDASLYGGVLPTSTSQIQPEADLIMATTPSPFPGMDTHSVQVGQEKRPRVEKARALFKSGLTDLENGSAPSRRGYKVDPQSARTAASLFKSALELVPNSVVYRYFYAVALRYSVGIEPALREFRQALELDPGHYEAQQQVTYGARWHDAFAYPTWVSPAPVEVGRPLPDSIIELLPEGADSVTRMVLLQEEGTKRTAFLSRTPLSAWSTPPSLHMHAHLHMVVSRTPYGPILTVYVIVHDRVHRPFIGEAFLNPREAVQNAEDACQLGQHMLEQLARQDRTYFIFTDEQNRLLLSRKVTFNTSTQVSIARCLYEVQTLPAQELEPARFLKAAQWHMEQVSLDQIREQFLAEDDGR